MKTISELSYGMPSFFRKCVGLNASETAYKILVRLTNDVYFPSENTPTAWVDIVVKENRYYAAYAQENHPVWPDLCIYIEIEPTEFQKDEYRYYVAFEKSK